MRKNTMIHKGHCLVRNNETMPAEEKMSDNIRPAIRDMRSLPR